MARPKTLHQAAIQPISPILNHVLLLSCLYVCPVSLRLKTMLLKYCEIVYVVK